MWWTGTSVRVDDQLLKDQFIKIIDDWVRVEIGKGISANSKLAEILIFDMKNIYTDSNVTKAFIAYLKQKTTNADGADFTFIRIQDLYTYLCMNFPTKLINTYHDNFISSLENMEYPVNKLMVKEMPYAWLIALIQYRIRYR